MASHGSSGLGAGAAGAASTVLEETIDESYEPTAEQIAEYAQWLGMDLEADKHLFWVAREGLKAPLPSEWKPCKSPDGEIYYFNFQSGESVWNHPCDEHFRSMYREEKKKQDTRPAAAENKDSDVPCEDPTAVVVVEASALGTAVFVAADAADSESGGSTAAVFARADDQVDESADFESSSDNPCFAETVPLVLSSSSSSSNQPAPAKGEVAARDCDVESQSSAEDETASLLPAPATAAPAAPLAPHKSARSEEVCCAFGAACVAVGTIMMLFGNEGAMWEFPVAAGWLCLAAPSIQRYRWQRANNRPSTVQRTPIVEAADNIAALAFVVVATAILLRVGFSGMETRLFAPICTKNTIILPRQARDKHRENSKKRRAFSVIGFGWFGWLPKTSSKPTVVEFLWVSCDTPVCMVHEVVARVLLALVSMACIAVGAFVYICIAIVYHTLWQLGVGFAMAFGCQSGFCVGVVAAIVTVVLLACVCAALAAAD
jgi:centrosomal protein CEP164